MSLTAYILVVVISLIVPCVKSEIAILNAVANCKVPVFHNGVYVGGTLNPERYTQIPFSDVHDHDVVTVLATNYGERYGAIADLS